MSTLSDETTLPEGTDLLTYLDNNHVLFEGWGCLVALSDDREAIFWCPLYYGEPERDGDHFNWSQVTAPEPDFLDDVNYEFGTNFEMTKFSGR